MFVLGHLGIGSALLAPVTRRGERRHVFLGALLPDLIDKPLYYGLAYATGRQGDALGLVSGTRTFGHSAALLVLVLLVGLLARRRAPTLVALGMVTHLVLDVLGDYVGAGAGRAAGGPPTLAAVFYPLLGWRFPVAHFRSATQHLRLIPGGYTVVGELVGGALLAYGAWRGGSGSR